MTRGLRSALRRLLDRSLDERRGGMTRQGVDTQGRVADDPWGWGRSLEWATASPPPPGNFRRLPAIYSDSPAFDLHHPEVGTDDLVD